MLVNMSNCFERRDYNDRWSLLVKITDKLCRQKIEKCWTGQKVVLLQGWIQGVVRKIQLTVTFNSAF